MMRIEGVKAGLLKLASFHAVAIPNNLPTQLPCYNSSVSRTGRSLSTLRNCSGCSFGVKVNSIDCAFTECCTVSAVEW